MALHRGSVPAPASSCQVSDPVLNLATFVTTWMEPQARALMTECVHKNMIDKDEYPQTAELERRCISMLADLWHASDPEEATG